MEHLGSAIDFLEVAAGDDTDGDEQPLDQQPQQQLGRVDGPGRVQEDRVRAPNIMACTAREAGI